jgi:hypothetical protein
LSPQRGRIVHAGGAGPFVYYDIEGVIEWMKERDHREKSGEEQRVPEVHQVGCGMSGGCALNKVLG